MKRRRLVVLGLGSLLFGGCYYPETLIGVLSDGSAVVWPQWDSAEPVFLPDSVAAGSRFTVVVYTMGGGCISFNSTRVDIDGNQATITPYDTFRTPGRSSGCDAYLTAIEHEATIRFTRKGQATVLIRVRESEYRRDVRVLRRTVHVF